MAKDLMKYDGTIAKALHDTQNEWGSLCNGQRDFNALHAAIIKVLDSEELKNNSASKQAKVIFNNLKAKNNFYGYLSTLGTYITSIKVL